MRTLLHTLVMIMQLFEGAAALLFEIHKHTRQSGHSSAKHVITSRMSKMGMHVWSWMGMLLV